MLQHCNLNTSGEREIIKPSIEYDSKEEHESLPLLIIFFQGTGKELDK